MTDSTQSLSKNSPPVNGIDGQATPQAAPISMGQVSLLKKMQAVYSKVTYIQKDKSNSFHNYRYASEAAIKDKLHAAFEEVGIVMLPPDILSVHDGEKDAKNRFLTTIQVRLTFADVETGASVSTVMYGRGIDNEDKGLYKAITGALKYFLTTTFLIPTGDDPEADEHLDQPQGKQTAGPPKNAAPRPQNPPPQASPRPSALQPPPSPPPPSIPQGRAPAQTVRQQSGPPPPAVQAPTPPPKPVLVPPSTPPAPAIPPRPEPQKSQTSASPPQQSEKLQLVSSQPTFRADPPSHPAPVQAADEFLPETPAESGEIPPCSVCGSAITDHKAKGSERVYPAREVVKHSQNMFSKPMCGPCILISANKKRTDGPQTTH